MYSTQRERYLTTAHLALRIALVLLAGCIAAIYYAL